MQAVSYYKRKRNLIRAKARQSKLSTTDGRVLYGLKKRLHKGYCELCGASRNSKGNPIQLDYHHWIEKDPQVGVWLCVHCHHLAEFLDQPNFPEIHNQYFQLKEIAKKLYYHGL